MANLEKDNQNLLEKGFVMTGTYQKTLLKDLFNA